MIDNSKNNRLEAWEKLADQIIDYINQYGTIDLWLDYGREYYCIDEYVIFDCDHPAILIEE